MKISITPKGIFADGAKIKNVTRVDVINLNPTEDMEVVFHVATSELEIDYQNLNAERGEKAVGTAADDAPSPAAEPQYMWRRFDLTTSDPNRIAELEATLDRHKDLTRRDLAVIVMGLRVRPGFELKDFDT